MPAKETRRSAISPRAGEETPAPLAGKVIGDERDDQAVQAEIASTATRREAILVLGMHRSGTSALTRVINLLGADLSSNLMPAAKDNNEAGFWESMDSSELNSDILASAYSSWDDWKRFNADWIGSAEQEAFVARARAILEQDFSGSSLFVLKDPRICRLLPFWLEVLGLFDTEPKIVLSVRNPTEVAASLYKRDGFSPSKSHRLWLRHVLDSEYGTRRLTRAVVGYDSLVGDWRSAVSKMSDDLGIAWPRWSTAVEAEIDRFLQPSHRHHATDILEIKDHPAVATWVTDAYGALIELQFHPESSEAMDRLDRIRADFDGASDSPTIFAHPRESSQANLATPSSIQKIHLEEAATASLEARIAELSAKLASEKKQTEQMRALKNHISLRLNEIQMSASWQLSQPFYVLEFRWPKLLDGIAAIPRLAWWAITLRLPERLRLRRQAKELLESGLFDLQWYVEQNPDIVLLGVNPVLHWLVTGWREYRDPNPWFNTSQYLREHPALFSSCVNPLFHYRDSEVKGVGTVP